MFYPRTRCPTPAQQLECLRRAQPDSSFQIEKGGQQFMWMGRSQPTEMSERYPVRIVMHRSPKRPPEVYVDSLPQMQVNGEEVPHVYSTLKKGARLCLWHPEKSEWSRQMLLAYSVLPWASLWLFFYEIWVATGEWLGGGEHPEGDN